MALLLSGCPGTWGIEDANDPNNTPWNIVLDQISAVGYRALELGPFGYLPQDSTVLRKELSKRNLFLIAGTLYDDLVSKDNLKRLIQKTHTTCNLLAQTDRPNNTQQFFVLIDMVKESKQYFAGQPQKSQRLNSDNFNHLIDNIREISKITQNDYGIKSVIHHHAGGYIEFEDEIDCILSEIERSHVGLCFDTGHAYYSKIDPSSGIRKYRDYIDYVHFKDIDAGIYSDSIARNTDFYQACANKVMCPIGNGCLNYREIKNALETIGYNGYITVEQDRDAGDTGDVVASIQKSINYLTSCGFEM